MDRKSGGKIMFSMRISPDLKAAAERAARADVRPLSQWIEKVVTDRLIADGYLPKPKK